MSTRSPAGSPPAPAAAALPNPRKRPSLTQAGSGTGGAKRRKASIYSASGSAHPLRQTSFPPEEDAFGGNALRSPSVETDITQSVAASVVGGNKRGRKRKSNAADGASVRSGPSTKGGTPARGRGDTASRIAGQDENEAGDDADDDDEELGEDEVDTAGQAMHEEKQRYALLFEAGDEEQRARLSQFRSVHLETGKLRKIVNQTLSQSVPKTTITAINSFTKYFIFKLIERAIEIQQQEDLGAIGALALAEDSSEEEEDDEEEEEDREKKNETEAEEKGAKEAEAQDQAAGISKNGEVEQKDENEGPKIKTEPEITQTNGTNVNGPDTPTIASPATAAPANSAVTAPAFASSGHPSTPSSAAPSPAPSLPNGGSRHNGGAGGGQGASSASAAAKAASLLKTKEEEESDAAAADRIQRKQHAAGRQITIGPLRPDCVREAYRRLQKEGDFGGVGTDGVSTGLGIQGAHVPSLGGGGVRRLFR